VVILKNYFSILYLFDSFFGKKKRGLPGFETIYI
jgi:hypothetical protein